jgi:pilus assembly protein Flp/PilA
MHRPHLFLNAKLSQENRFEWRKIDKYPEVYAIRFSRLLTLAGNRSRMKTIQRFFADESGATAIEYGLIAAAIALAIFVVVDGLAASSVASSPQSTNSLK